MVLLPPMFHWSPAARRDSISVAGLRAWSPPTTCTAPAGWISLSPDPRTAWQLSGAMEWVADVDVWDLWQVWLADGDQVHVRPEFGPRLAEVQVGGGIPADRVWLVGQRERP